MNNSVQTVISTSANNNIIVSVLYSQTVITGPKSIELLSNNVITNS